MTKSKKESLNEYFFYHDKYTKIYGENTVVLYRSGDFYEIYGLLDKAPNMLKISETTNMAKTRKKKAVDIIDMDNPYMMGYNHTSHQKFLKLLVEGGFTCIVVDQVTPPPKPKRAVTGVCSAGTYINDTETQDSNNIISIYIEDEKQLNGTYLSCIGLSTADLSTGNTSVYEIYSSLHDDKYALDEAYRFVISHNPKEVIVTRKTTEGSFSKEYLLSYLELDKKNVHYSEIPNKIFNKLSYQNEFFGKIYKNTGMMSPVEYLDIEKLMYARMSLLILFDFAYKHNESFINNLNKPIIFQNSEHLILGNDAVYQLNILENNSVDTAGAKFRSVFDVVNNTSTAMGRRFLKNTLCQPLNNITEIQARYDCTEEMIQNDLYKNIEKHLESILDIERLGRRLFLGSLHPYELANLMDSFNEIDNLHKLIIGTNHNKKYKLEDIILKQSTEFLAMCNKTFAYEELKKQNLTEITASFFKKGVHLQIDELDDKVVNNIKVMEEVGLALSNYAYDAKSKPSPTSVKLKKNNRDGYYLALTNKRGEMLRNNIKELKTIKVSETLSIDPNKLLIKDAEPAKSGKIADTKIFFADLNSKSDNAISLKEKMIAIIKKKYLDLLAEFGHKYKDMFRQLSHFIAQIDFIKSNAKTAKLYNYCKPEIIKNDNNGYLNAIKMRHPIAERLRTDVEYVTHDIRLGKSINYNENDVDKHTSMILYGPNGVGKSLVQKAIGSSIIMAQSGMFVAAEKYQYSPYESLFARITGSDNMFKGLSQFGLEMTELRAILKRNNAKTLVIGDEVCRGTEHKSGNSLVATTLIKLSQKDCSFIFATHLHDIPEMKRIKELKNIKICHLTTKYDKPTDSFIYDRLLKDGPGSSLYGIDIAKNIIKDDDFIKLAYEILNEMDGKPKELLSNKKSKYNSHVYVDACQICNKQNDLKLEHVGLLDVHHINFQCNCNEDGFIIGKSYIPMNNKSNLIVLCKTCHHKAHHDELTIKGYLDTTNGRIVDYEFQQKIVTKKKVKTQSKPILCKS